MKITNAGGLILLVVAATAAAERPPAVDLRTPTKWTPGEVVTATVMESTLTKVSGVSSGGGALRSAAFETRLDARFVQHCIETDPAGRPLRSLVRIDAWSMVRASGTDRCLEGAVVEVSPSGWRLAAAAANPSRSARRWLDNRFGPDGRGFSGGLAELGSTGPVAAGDSWSADPPAIAGGLARGGVPVPLPRRPWRFTLAEAASSPAGTTAKVVFDETFPVAGEAKPEGRTIRVAEGSRVRAYGEISGVPGEWHRTGRMTAVSETDLDTSSEGTAVRMRTTAEEREAWEPGGRAPEPPAGGAVAIGGSETWSAGDTMLETGSERRAMTATPVDADDGEGTPERSEGTVAWTAEIECVEATSEHRPRALVVVLRDWTLAEGGEKDRSLAGAVLRVGPDGWKWGSGGEAASDRAEEWVRARFGQGVRSDDPLRAALTPAMAVSAKQTWLSDPEATLAALLGRFGPPMQPEGVRGTGSLVGLRGSGDAAEASIAYEVEAAISCAPGCDGAGADVLKGTVRVKGVASGPAARWTRLGSLEERADASVTVPGQAPGEDRRRLAIVEERRIERAPLAAEGRSARSWTEAAAAKVDRRDYDGALADASRALGIDPALGDAWFQRARAKAGTGDAAGAVADYTKVVEVEPDSSAAYYNRGGQKRALGDLEGAIEDYSAAIDIAPRFAQAYRNRGVARAAKGDHAGAVEDYDGAIGIRPRYVEAYNDRGLAHYNLREYAAAIEDYTKAAELDPKRALYLVNRGNARSAAGDLEGSLGDHDAAIALDPAYGRAHYFRADVRGRAGDVKGALEDYARAMELDPKFASNWNDRGCLLQEQGDHEGAIADFSKAMEMDPRDRNPAYNRARSRAMKGDLEGAIEDCTLSLEIDPRYAFAYNRRAGYREDVGDGEGAIADWQKALDLAPRLAGAHRSLALARFLPGRPAGPVVEGLRRAIEADEDPDYEHLWLWLARAGTGEEGAATKELLGYAAAREPEGADDWYPVLVGLLSGTTSEEAALEAAGPPDSKKGRERLCEAAYYAGMLCAIRGDVPGAVERFDRCLATGVRNFTEHTQAGRWRAALLLGGSLQAEVGGATRVVVSPDPRGPLGLAGVGDGDRISGIDGTPLQPGQLEALLLKAAPGTKLRLDVDRSGTSMQREVTLGAWQAK